MIRTIREFSPGSEWQPISPVKAEEGKSKRRAPKWKWTVFSAPHLITIFWWSVCKDDVFVVALLVQFEHEKSEYTRRVVAVIHKRKKMKWRVLLFPFYLLYTLSVSVYNVNRPPWRIQNCLDAAHRGSLSLSLPVSWLWGFWVREETRETGVRSFWEAAPIVAHLQRTAARFRRTVSVPIIIRLSLFFGRRHHPTVFFFFFFFCQQTRRIAL